MSAPAEVPDPPFRGVGQKLGIDIWRIENFHPVLLPKSEPAKFYMGDSYIILKTASAKGGSYLHDIHFWIGRDTSQDEAGTAAMKSIELDVALGGHAVLHREPQGDESDKFLSCFKPCFMPLEGGVASGFKKPEAWEFENRLYVCHGRRVIRLKQVPFARSSLNHDDVFVLDTQKKIFQFNGASSNIQERAKALEVIQFFKDKYHGGTCDIAIVEDGKLDTESHSGEFWVIFGGFAPIGRKIICENEVASDTSPAKLICVIDGVLRKVDGELSKGLLENDKCFLLDCGNEIFVWFGRATQVEERKAASKAAELSLAGKNHPHRTRITSFNQGFESHSFKSYFDSWSAGTTIPAAKEGRGKVAALLKQQHAGVKGMVKNALVDEEIPLLLEKDGKMEVWCINGTASIPLFKENVGKFYSGDCYIIFYTSLSVDKKGDSLLCYWCGKDSTKEDQNMAARLINTMLNSMKCKPVQCRVCQGMEPPLFVALFQPMIVLKGGLSTSYKKLIAEKHCVDETYSADCIALFRISGTYVYSNQVVQVDAMATSLNSTECFLLQSGSSIYTWHGNQSSDEQQRLATEVAEFLRPGVNLKLVKEGTENSTFWFSLGGKQSYNNKKASSDIICDPHLFTVSSIKGNLHFEEVHGFCQDDLLTEDILILDTHSEVFVWVGQSVDSEEKLTAFEIGQKYIDMASTLDGLSRTVPLYRVVEGNEPVFFTTYFQWDPAKATVQGNSFQKKAALLFGIGHHVMEVKPAGNQRGQTQRASALAALSSAFNPSFDKSSHLGWDKPNDKTQMPTQRASAMAALSSAFTSFSPSKTVSQRSAGTNQGSQRAAAVAALSSVLTAEKKAQTCPRSTDSSLDVDVENEVPLIVDTEDHNKHETAKVNDDVASVSETNGGLSDSKQDELKVDNNEQTERLFTYAQLKVHSENPVSGIDFKQREAYLSDEEFCTLFGVVKEAFYELPKWKQDLQKKKFDLF